MATVELPATHLFYHPILVRLSTARQPVHRQVIIDEVADLLKLDEEQKARLANDQTPSHAYRSGWSLSVLKKAGLLANPSTGYWALTDQGRQLLRRFSRELDKASIAGINAVWWTKKEEEELQNVAGTGQGLGLTASQRKAIEDHAMLKAEQYLTARGWKCKNTSANKPYDYVAKRNGANIIVEVKGTTGKGHSILLTANEVEKQQEEHPQNALIVVHSIALNRKSQPPKASRGEVLAFMPWRIVQDRLVPKVYQYGVEEDGDAPADSE
jgi:hypothetical protein